MHFWRPPRVAHSVCCDVILGAISRFLGRQIPPGSVIISDASNIRGQRSKVTEHWLNCSFGAIYGATKYECRIVLKLDKKDLNSEAKHICCNNKDQI